MKVIFVFILLSVLITRSMAYIKCNVDECVLSVDCPMLMKVLNKNTLNLDDVEFLNSRICSESNGQILVCCKEKQTIKEPERIIETTTSVPTTLHCGDSGFSSMLGGTKTSIDEFPWTALIQYTYPNGERGFHCGGVLISDQHVLTSSNCVNGKAITEARYKLTGVRLGDWQLSFETDCDELTKEIYCAEPHRDFVVEETFSHENYDPQSTNQHNDIALLTLSEKINKFTRFINPICLPIKEFVRDYNLTRDDMFVAGWGLTINSTGSDIKYRQYYLEEVNQEECQSTYSSTSFNISSSQMCAKGGIYQNPSFCQSGEPLMRQIFLPNHNFWYLVGIMSYGSPPCNETSWPKVYTRVDHYIDWIASKMNPQLFQK